MTNSLFSEHPRRRLPTLAATFALLALVSGCGESGPERVPVFPTEGKVIWNGQPVPGALVVLHPSDGKPVSARAQTGKDGSFKISTYDTGDGAPLGDYVITVEWRKLIQKDGEFKAGPNVLPPKYSQRNTSDLKVHIAEGTNVLDPITLKR